MSETTCRTISSYALFFSTTFSAAFIRPLLLSLSNGFPDYSFF
jgi:hypothetical protein